MSLFVSRFPEKMSHCVVDVPAQSLQQEILEGGLNMEDMLQLQKYLNGITGLSGPVARGQIFLFD